MLGVVKRNEQTMKFNLLLFSLLVLIACEEKTKQETSIEMSLEIDSEISIEEIHKAYAAGSYTAADLTKFYLQRIEEFDKAGPNLNAVLLINPDALSIAAELDEELKNGKKRGMLHGIPVLLKDNIDTKDKMPCTAGAIPMKDSYPLEDSPLAAQLREAGAIILGKANMSEWANFHSSFSSSGWSGLGGQTKNPYVLAHNPCGSSAGSGVAVAANLTVLAIGTETNGSIVCPSTNNGIVGIKPTVGLISRSGIIPISFTQDTPGPMARSVRDAALCLSVLTMTDNKDSKTLVSDRKAYADYSQFLKLDGIKGKRIAYLTEHKDNNEAVWDLMENAMAYFKEQGAELIEIKSILPEETGTHSFQVLLYEFKDGLNKYFKELGPNAKVKSLEDLISQTLGDSIEMQYFDHALLTQANEKGSLESPEYKKALATMLKQSREEGIDKIMNELQVDAIIAPTGKPAWKTDLIKGDDYGLSSSSPAAISGYPNVTVPMGFVGDLPVNISIFGRAWSEPILLEIAYAFEQGTKHRTSPKFLK